MIELISASNIAIDFAIAKLDKKNEGLSFGFIDGIFCGYFIENGQVVPATYLVGNSWRRQILAKKNPKFKDAISYCPSEDWSQARSILMQYKVGFFFEQENNKWVSSVNKIEGDEPIVVALKDIIKSKYGEYLDLGIEIESHLQSIALKT